MSEVEVVFTLQTWKFCDISRFCMCPRFQHTCRSTCKHAFTMAFDKIVKPKNTHGPGPAEHDTLSQPSRRARISPKTQNSKP